jgi:hypothetical protein
MLVALIQNFMVSEPALKTSGFMQKSCTRGYSLLVCLHVAVQVSLIMSTDVSYLRFMQKSCTRGYSLLVCLHVAVQVSLIISTDVSYLHLSNKDHLWCFQMLVHVYQCKLQTFMVRNRINYTQ